MSNAPGRRASRPRSDAHYSDERGDTYLIHFERKFHHAGHYRGWTPRSALERFADHLAGRGANLTAKVAAAGIGMKLARVWPDTTRDYEDAIKHMGGAARLCPECGATPGTPRLDTGTPRPEAAAREHRPLWQLDRLGTTSDGEPLPSAPGYTEAGQYRARHQVPEPGPDVHAEQAALDELARSWTHDEEDQMTLRDTIGRVFDRGARAAARAREAERDRAHAEADRLAAVADQIDLQAGRRPVQPLPLSAERAARVRDYIAPGPVRDARAQAATQAPEPVLQGPDLDAELGRLAEAFPDASAERPVMGEDYYRQPVGSDRHREAYREYTEAMHERDGGIGYGGYEVDNAAELAYDRYAEEGGPDSNHIMLSGGMRVAMDVWDRYVTSQPGSDEHKAAYVDMHRQAGGDGFPSSDPDLSYLADHGYETDADRFRWPEGRPEPEEVEGPGAEPGPDAAEWSPSLEDPGTQAEEDLAAAAADHDRSLRFGRIAAAQAAMSGSTEERQLEQRSIRLNMSSRRAAEREAWIAAADMQEAAEPEMPDHIYGAPECAEADPETAHFGSAAPEAQDRGRWPLPRVLEPSEVSAIRAPEAGALPDGTPHADPQQAARGWQAQCGLYARAPQMQAEAV